jgi:hypothetical protein
MCQRRPARRELFRGDFFATLPGLFGGAAAAQQAEPNIYQSIGVKPLINGRGTFTINRTFSL